MLFDSVIKCTAGSLLEKVVEMNSELAQRVKETTRTDFLDYLVQHRSAISMTNTLPIWEMLQLVKAKVALVNADIDSFQSVLEITSSLLKQQYM